MRVAWLKDLRLTDLEQVGGKNASLGEMIGGLAAAGIRVPGGFATTAAAFREFLGDLGPRIEERLRHLDPTDVKALAACGAEIRSWITKAPFPEALEREIRSKYQSLTESTSSETSFAVRSSATAEDLPEASFAGQQETFLNIRGIDNVLEAIREVFASLYNDRAISYRAHVVVDQGREHDRLAVLLLRGDARQAFLGLLGRVHERHGDLVELHAFELRQQAVAQHLRRNAGTVGDEENGSAQRDSHGFTTAER